MKLSNKHRKTLEAIFERPTRANIPWMDIEKLFIALGADIEEKGGSVIKVTLVGRQVFHRPHPQKEAKRYMVREVEDFLLMAGISL